MIISLSSSAQALLCEIWIVMAVGSTVLAMIVFLCLFVLRRASASIRFAVLRGFFCGLLALPVLAIVLPGFGLGWYFDHKFVQVESRHQPERNPSIEPRAMSDKNSRSSAGIPKASPPSELDRPKPPENSVLPIQNLSDGQFNLLASPFDSPQASPPKSPGQISSVIIWLVGWLLVASFILLRLALGLRQVRNAISSAIPVDAGEIASRTGLEPRELGKVEFYLSNQFSAPVTTGIRRPIVLLLGSSFDLDSEILKMVVRHELAHVERRDVLWQAFFSITCAVYCFHPLVWFANRLAQRERELACDDRVLADGTSPEVYASVLLDHVAAATGRPVQWGAAIPMAHSPIAYRINAILDENTCRYFLSSRLSATIAVLAAVLATIAGTVRPFQGARNAYGEMPAQQQNVENQASDHRLPKLLSGKIVDERGQPLEGVMIELQFTTWTVDEKVSVSRRVDHKKWELVTDKAGTYTIDTTGLNTSAIRMDRPELNFIGWASGKGRIEQPVFQTGKDVVQNGKFRSVVLPVGRLVTGRVRPPLNAEQELLNPRVNVAGPNHWLSRPLLCDNEGRFSLYVPKVGEVEVLAFADNFAATRIFAGKDKNLGDIELQHGTRITGQVLDVNGDPVSGVVVTIKNDRFNELSQLHRNGTLTPHAAVKTEMDGYFQFPPHVGPCTVAVVNKSRTHDSESNFLNLWASRKPPVVLPKAIDLDGSVESMELILRECETVAISGRVTWPDGRGASGVEIRGSVMAGGEGIDLDFAKTNENGEYHLRLPDGCDRAAVHCLGARDEDSVWHYADPLNNLDAVQKSRQILGLKILSGDVTGANWRLVRKKDRAKAAPVSKKTRDSENALAEIASRYFRATAETRNRTTFASEVLELEESYRGETAALNALRLALRWTSDSTTPEITANYREALRRLEKHYLGHPELDGVMPELSRQFDVDSSIKFLRVAEQNNPHPQVQAAAMLFQMHILATQIDMRESLEQNKWIVQGFEKFPVEYQTGIRQLVANLRELNPQDCRGQIESISRRIKQKFGNVERQGFISNMQSFRQRRYKPSQAEKFGELADRAMFQVSRLKRGEIIEDFEGKDVNGNRFKFSDHRGKVVMLMFSANWCGPCKEMYAENRKLVSEFKDRPFQLISVMGDHQVETVAAAVDSGEITWLTTWDGKDGPIANKWNINNWPTVLIVDHLGFIRSTVSDSATRSRLIEDLVEQAESKRDK